MAEQKSDDYKSRLNKARNKRNGKDPMKYFMYAAGGIIVILLVVVAVKLARGGTFAGSPKARMVNETDTGEAADQDASGESESVDSENAEPTMSPEELAQAETDAQKKSVVESYNNLGLVQVSGYLNMRESASKDAKVIGKLLGGSACEILDDSTEGWYQISSGGLTGYISSEFVLTGEEAKAKAEELVALRAIITVDALNIRKEPTTESDAVGQALKNERYVIEEDTGDGWLKIPSGYIASEFVEQKYALNEARKLDMKSMVLNLYKNIGISSVDNYLNVREEPSEDGKIIGKMTSKSAGDILETTEDGQWYKIHSGPVTGYVKAEYILTGASAKNEALNVAELMAIVSTDRLNVRTEPSTESQIWTQISNNERYAVLSQTDGWVEIELDSTSAYVSTDFVDVRYALPEAIKFSPLDANVSLRNKIVNYALQFVGGKYVWGGNDPHTGADCSGFTKYVYSKVAGITLNRVSRDQAKQGKQIKSSEMRPGDLIFYTNSKGTINHVAMYIGNGQIVHAASRRSGIKISTWNYRNPYRIINLLGD